MRRMIRERPGTWIGAGGVLVLLLLGSEFFVPWPEVRWSVRWAVIVGVLGFPLLWQVYRLGLFGPVKSTLLWVGVAVVYKLALILLTSLAIFVWLEGDVIVYSFLLFFLLFGLTFVAIYLADAERTLRSGK